MSLDAISLVHRRLIYDPVSPSPLTRILEDGSLDLRMTEAGVFLGLGQIEAPLTADAAAEWLVAQLRVQVALEE